MAPDALALLFERAESVSRGAGENVFCEGDVGAKFYLIKSGSVRVVKKIGTPDEVLLARLGPRDFFGEMCIFDTLPRAATVQATEVTELICLSPSAFYHLYKARPEQHSILLLNIARDLSRRLRKLDEAYAARI